MGVDSESENELVSISYITVGDATGFEAVVVSAPPTRTNDCIVNEGRC